MLETNKDSFSPILTAGLILMLAPFVIGFVLFAIDTLQHIPR